MKSQSRSVKGSVAIITGAASGMGRATAFVFAREGARVAAVDVNREGAEHVAGDIEKEGGEARAWRLDVSDAGAIAETIDAIAKHFGAIDIIVNNAGIAALTALD